MTVDKHYRKCFEMTGRRYFTESMCYTVAQLALGSSLFTFKGATHGAWRM